LAPATKQGTAIAAIVWVGALGAILGPLLTPFEKAVARRLGLDELVGPFLFAAALCSGFVKASFRFHILANLATALAAALLVFAWYTAKRYPHPDLSASPTQR
jgi:hypothetical protein